MRINFVFKNFVSVGTMNLDRHHKALKYQNGAQNSKQVKQKEENLQKVFTKTPKTDSCFSVSMSQQPDENVPGNTS